jgi:geranylgeranyl diphosphate synthase type I
MCSETIGADVAISDADRRDRSGTEVAHLSARNDHATPAVGTIGVRSTSLPASLSWARDLTLPALRGAVVSRLCPELIRVAGYHHGWLEADGAPTAIGGGKALRPALVLLSAQAADARPSDGLPAAVATELVHNFSLLQDDIIDRDTVRRHRPTAWTTFGTSVTILTGDALLAAALDTLLEHPGDGARAATRRLVSALQRLLNGQAADLDFESRHDVSLQTCLSMSRDKTSALLGCASSIGAAYVGGPSSLVDGLAKFGEHLGTAFQLADDILGIWGNPQLTGTPALSDLRSRKKTLPVVAALGGGGPAADELAELYFRAQPLDEEELLRAAELVERAGGRELASSLADDELTSALLCLDDLSLAAEIHAEFVAIARLITDREC